MPISFVNFLLLLVTIVHLEVHADDTHHLNLTYENYLRVGGDPLAFKQTLCFLRNNENRYFARGRLRPLQPNIIKIRNKQMLLIADLTKPSDQPRLFRIDLKTHEVKAYIMAHGSGVPGQPVELFEPDKIDPLDLHRILFPVRISNELGSYATPRGIFILDETYSGQFGYSLRMHGLQKNINDNSLARFIVLHGFSGMNRAAVSSEDPYVLPIPTGNLALSQGCTMLEPLRAKEVIDSAQGGSLYYVYSSYEKNRGPAYCADENLMAIDPPIFQ